MQDLGQKWVNVTSLSKTDPQNFPRKCLFTLRMIRNFINVWMNLVVLLSTAQGPASITKHSIPPEYFVLNSESGFTHFSTTGSLTKDNTEYGSENKDLLKVPNFPWNNCLDLKTFLIKKTWEYMFLLLRDFGKNHIPVKMTILHLQNYCIIFAKKVLDSQKGSITFAKKIVLYLLKDSLVFPNMTIYLQR